MWALDTNTISYYLRGDPAVVPRLQELPPAEVGVPAVVLYELRYGLLRLPEEAARPRLAALDHLIAPVQVLPFDEGSAQAAARIRAELERQGNPIGPHDLLIAATALHHAATLITRNVREFSRIEGLDSVSWHQD